MPRNLRCGAFVALILSVLGLLTSCGNLSSAPINNTNAVAAVSVTILPSSITVGTGTVTQFVATVNGAGLQTVQWEVNGVPGGAAAIGTIDSNGNYTAPRFVPNPASVVITAIADADNTKSGIADVGITGTLFPATVYLSPTGTAYVQKGTQLKLSAGVTGPADTSVVWQVNGVPNGNASVGTISAASDGTATYTAPSSPANVTIRALSHAEQGVYQSCAVTVSAGPPTVPTVTIMPALAAAGAENNFTFTASLIGDTAVTWSVEGVTGGTSEFGTIASESDLAGVYTGPIVAPLGNIATVRATSVADPARNSSAAVLISPPPANGISVKMNLQGAIIPVDSSTLISATVEANSITGTVSDTNVTWEVNGIAGGNSTYGTVQVVPNTGGTSVTYFSPQQVPAQSTVIVEAIAQQDPSVVGTVPVTITPVKTTVVVATPSGQSVVNLGVNQTQIFDATITGPEDQTALWYICPNSQNCILNGNATYGTISPTTPTDEITYTAPATIPSPSTVILKAVSHANPTASGTATITIQQNPVITVIASPKGPLTDEVGLTYNGDFSAVVTGTDDQNVSWNVCTSVQPQVCYAGGNATYGMMMPDPNNPTDDLYQAPASIPNPNPVFIEAVPEADPSVVSNAIQMTITPFQQAQTVTINLQYNVILPTQPDTVSAEVSPGPNQTVNWTLQLPANEGGGDCTSQPLICGNISPPQTDNTQATYTPPNPIPNGQTSWVVEITATSPIYNVSDTVPVTISQDATTTISISPPSGTIQAGSGQFINFNVNIVNGSQDQDVDWTLSCATEANDGEFCGLPFGDGQWTGCLAGAGGNVCESGALPPPDPANTPVTYTPPPKTGNQYSNEENSCPSQPGQDVIAVTADINGNGNNCVGNSCEATACILITPAAK